MSLTPSTMLPLGTEAPDFYLSDTNGGMVGRDDFREAPALVVIFMCNHCPYVQHVRKTLPALVRGYQAKGVAVVGINANDAAGYPEDSIEAMKREVQSAGYPFPYLFDETQETARAYRAACTPDFYLFDKDQRLVYRGQMDDSRPSNGIPVTGRDLTAAVEAVLTREKVRPDQKASLGCNIKWKPGNEPDYYR